MTDRIRCFEIVTKKPVSDDIVQTFSMTRFVRMVARLSDTQFLAILEHDLREDDFRAIAAAVAANRHVTAIRPYVREVDDLVTRGRNAQNLHSGMFRWLHAQYPVKDVDESLEKFAARVAGWADYVDRISKLVPESYLDVIAETR